MSKILFIFILILSSCAFFPEEEIIRQPQIARNINNTTIRTYTANIGDVRLFSNLMASYVPVREERLSFELDSIMISNIYVQIGDYVQEGDIVASLHMPELVQAYRDMEREEEWVRLHIQSAQIRRISATDRAVYNNEIHFLSQQLDILQLQREYLENEIEKRLLRAPLDGVVTHVMAVHEGMLSNALHTLMVISDPTETVFAVRGNLLINDTHIIHFNHDSYNSIVIDQDEEFSYLVITDDIFNILGNPFIQIILDEVQDVLRIPVSALRTAGDRAFVHVLVDGVRVLQDVEVGLIGNEFVEIISGLQEGDNIVLG